MANKILILDTCYPNFLKSLKPFEAGSYGMNLATFMEAAFGTADFYSSNLALEGWETVDIIANSDHLQELWCRQYGYPYEGNLSTVYHQVNHYKPDVLFCQDLSFIPADRYKAFPCRILAGQCSCPMPPQENVKQFNVLFTSFPHYVEIFEQMGIKAVYNKLAFEETLLQRIPRQERVHDVVFVGGVGYPSHWKAGMDLLEQLALEIPTFKCWGYGYDALPESSPLRKCYQGEAWGLEMYKILAQSKIVINRHGEVAQGYTNNMRCFEATGMGALLMTESSKNLSDFFITEESLLSEVLSYRDPKDAIEKIKYLLAPENQWEIQDKALRGQQRTLKDHTYSRTMKVISETLKGML